MTFQWPLMLWAWLLVPVAVGLYLWLQWRRQAARRATLGLVMMEAGQGARRGLRRYVPPVFFLVALACLVTALARPEAVVSQPHLTGTVILAFDVSGSMAADDLKPTRIDAAKAAARDFVQRQPSTVKIGVVSFSDNGFSVQVPTNDPGPVAAAIERLSPQRGTSLANGILTSLNTIAVSASPPAGSRLYSNLTPEPTPSPTPVPAGQYTPAVIILLTDGENNESPDPLAAAQAAAERGVRINTVGLGSAAGADLRIEGFTIHSQLDEGLLKQISQITGGTYYNAASTQDLSSIYSHLVPQLVVEPEKMEVTSLLAGAGLLALLIGGVFSLVWLGRLP
jgi:Ca-activated chloride channel homolog